MGRSFGKRRQGKRKKKRGGVGGGRKEKKRGGVGGEGQKIVRRVGWVVDDVMEKNKNKK